MFRQETTLHTEFALPQACLFSRVCKGTRIRCRNFSVSKARFNDLPTPKPPIGISPMGCERSLLLRFSPSRRPHRDFHFLFVQERSSTLKQGLGTARPPSQRRKKQTSVLFFIVGFFRSFGFHPHPDLIFSSLAVLSFARFVSSFHCVPLAPLPGGAQPPCLSDFVFLSSQGFQFEQVTSPPFRPSEKFIDNRSPESGTILGS